MEKISVSHSYKYFRLTNPKILTNEELSVYPDSVRYEYDKKAYLKIVLGLFKFIIVKMFQGYDIRLGAKLGIIGVRGKKMEPKIFTFEGKERICGVPVDWGATNKLWASDPIAKEKKTRIFHFNEHSNGVKYKIYWSRRNVIIINKVYYSMLFSRLNERELARLIKEGREFQVLNPKLEKNVRLKATSS